MKTNKTAAIMNHLRENGPVSSAHIASALPGVRTKDVTALLKKQMARGQVIRSAGLLSINPSWDDRLVEAMRLLKQSGYTVYEPGSRPAGRAECEKLRKDAERYRFIRDTEELPMNLMRLDMMGDLLDAAIDAAMQEQQP